MAIKMCRFRGCMHPGGIIEPEDACVHIGNLCYHADCYAMRQEDGAENLKADRQYILNLWLTNINPAVLISDLNRVINDMLRRGLSSDYLVFVLEYVIAHHWGLNYPSGLRYYVDNEEIKKKYADRNRAKIPKDAFVVKNEPEVKLHGIAKPKKETGFGGILGRQK